MLKVLFLAFLTTVLAADSDVSNLLRLFQKEDKDKDGVLTSAQFVQGLISVFVNQGLEKDFSLVNSFGREFMGRKRTRGVVRLEAVEAWLTAEELQNAYADWKHIKDEGEGHHHRQHKHRRAGFASLSKNS